MQFKQPLRSEVFAVVLLVAGLGLAVLASSNPYSIYVLTLVPIWGTMGLSWNLLGGYLGLVSFGQAAFFGLGAFTVVILARDYEVTPWIGLPLGALVGAISAIIIGAITFRFRGFYFALAILAFPLALLNVFDWVSWTEVSIPIHRDNPWAFMQFEDPRILGFFALAFFAIALLVSLVIERTRFGLSLVAIRQDEIAARVAGIRSFENKLKAITVSGALAAVAGGLYALVLLVVTPGSVFGLLVSAQALIIPMFGGRGTAWGAAIGAVILVPLSEWLHGHFGAALPGIGGLVFGLAIIAVVMLLPNGIYWAVRDLASILLKRTDVVSGDADPAPAYADGAASHVTPANAETRETEMTLRDVSVSFGGVQALQSVSFDIKRAEILGIIGPNGAGKTTLFNVVSGLVRPSSGEIVVGKGVSLIGRSPEQICAAGIGRTFQTVRVFRRLSLLENVVVGAFVQVKDDRAALEKARQVLTRVGLGDRMGALGGSLNNLELRLMEFARALAGSPKIVLLDECFAGLAGDDIGQIMALLRKLRDEGLTIVIIEHTMDAMAKLVDRMIVMNYGKVLAEGQPKDVLGNQEVITAYLGKRWAQHAEN